MMLGQRVGYAKHRGPGWDDYQLVSFECESTCVIIQSPTGTQITAPLKDVIDFPDEPD